MRPLHRPAPAKRSRQQGFSLVEVLVSIVVLSFGMLGMVGLQAAALQANREAKYQSSAVNLARELAEMMRGNKLVGTAIGASNPYLRSVTDAFVAPAPTYCLNVAGTAACASGAATANAQMAEWLTRVEAELPGAKVAVCFDVTPYDAAGLPQWACSDSGTTAFVKVGWTKASTNRSATGAAAFERATIPSIILPVTAGSNL